MSQHYLDEKKTGLKIGFDCSCTNPIKDDMERNCSGNCSDCRWCETTLKTSDFKIFLEKLGIHL